MDKAEREELPHIWAPDAETWRQWLEEHHATTRAIWLCYFKKNAGPPTIDWSTAVDEALCFGWIDSVIRPLDPDSYKQYFTQRKPKSNWSLINKAKIERLIEEGRVMPAGLAAIERAKANGSWNLTDERDALVILDDLALVLSSNPLAQSRFAALSVIRQWELVHWIAGTRRAESRANRIQAVIAALEAGSRPEGLRL